MGLTTNKQTNKQITNWNDQPTTKQNKQNGFGRIFICLWKRKNYWKFERKNRKKFLIELNEFLLIRFSFDGHWNFVFLVARCLWNKKKKMWKTKNVVLIVCCLCLWFAFTIGQCVYHVTYPHIIIIINIETEKSSLIFYWFSDRWPQ